MRAKIVTVLAPGLILIILGGALMDEWPRPARAASLAGFITLVGWPLVVIITEVRHRWAARRGTPDPPKRDRLYEFVTAVQTVTLTIVLPVTIFGGLGVYCLVTAVQDAEHSVARAVVGVACLLLLGAFLAFITLGRSSLLLQFVGVPVAMLGLGVGAWSIQDWQTDRPTVGTAVGLLASVGLLLAGGWLAMTARNTVRRHPDRHPPDAGGST